MSLDTWKTPPLIKVYEALGALADERVEITGSEAKVYSSSRGKFYRVAYDEASGAITANDNGSYWQGYLGYPAIAFLMKIGKLSYDANIAASLSGIAWKDLNTKYKNDYQKVLQEIGSQLYEKGINAQGVELHCQEILKAVIKSNYKRLGTTAKPPAAY